MQFRTKEQMPAKKGGMFLKLGDGEEKTGVFVGPVEEKFAKFVDGKSVDAGEKDPDAKFRFKINFVTHEDGKFVAKIWEGGASVYEQLRDLHAEYNLPETKVKIKRKGLKLETEYSILPTKEQLTDAQKAAIAAVPLNDLAGEPVAEKYDSADKIPFSL